MTDYHVILGGNTHDDVRKRYPIARYHGYLNAGGGRQFSVDLDRLRCGDRVYAYVGRINGVGGYVGIAEVTGEAMWARDATVDGSGRLICHPHVDEGFKQRARRDDDTTEKVVPIKWLEGPVDPADAVYDTDWPAFRRIVVELKPDNPDHQDRIGTVEEAFGVSST